MAESVTFRQELIAAIAVAVGLGLGIALRLLFGRMRHRARSTAWVGDDLVVGLLHDLALPLCAVASVWFAVDTLPLLPRWTNLAVGVLTAVLILVVTLITARLVAEGTRATMVRRTGGGSAASIFVNVARLAVVVVGLLVLLDQLGVSIAPLLTALGVGGLAVALALQDTLSNLFAGVHILASRKVQVGDFVRLESGEEGEIVDINWRNTTIRTVQNNYTIIPNARFAESVVINFFRPVPEMSILVPVGVAYDSDLDHVERVAVDVATQVMREVPGGVHDHEPVVRFRGFGESSIDLNVILRTTEFAQQYVIVSEFVKRLHSRFAAESIEIPFPIRTVNLTRDSHTIRLSEPETAPKL